MADLAQLEAALVKADAAGNADDARMLAGEIRRMRAPTAGPKPTPTFTPGPEGFRKSLNEAIDADVSPAGARFVGGMGTMLDQAALRAKQAFSTLTPQDVQKVEANRMLQQSPLGFMGAATGGAMMFPTLPVGSLPAAAATGGAIATATNPVLQGESEIGNTVGGGAGGAAGNLLVRGVSRLARPIIQSAPVQALLREGIVPTPGQAAGAGSVLGRVEQKLQSIPIIGDIITHGRNRAVGELNEAAISRAIPGGGTSQGVGRGAIERADTIISDGYNDVLSRIGTVRVDPNVLQRMGQVIADPDLALPPAVQQRLHEMIQTQITGRAGAGGQMQAQIAKRADANLGMLARTYANSTDADQRMMARGIREIQAAWRDNIRANATPELQAELDGLNRAFANFVRVEKAAGSPGAREGVFSPAQLSSAVRATDTSARKGQFAQGGALMQDLSDPAMATLHQTVPNSGTIDRGLIAMLAGGGLAGGNEYLGGPGYLSALALAPLIYSRGGSRYMLGNLPGQQAAAQGILALDPVAQQGGRLLGQQFNQR